MLFPKDQRNLKWKQNAKTIAGGNGRGNKLNQLSNPHGIYVDYQHQSIYIADCWNHRIVKWKLGESNGQIVAGVNGKGTRIDQLNCPNDVISDQNSKSLIFCDFSNRRIVRWSLENQQDRQILVDNIDCSRLMMNENGDLFVSDYKKHEVKRWRKDEKEGIIVAGGNGEGVQLNQLFAPSFIFVDRQETVYVSDEENHRVMKWVKGAKEGIVVAGGHGKGNSLKQLDRPQSLIVNQIGDIYVTDLGNHRIICWPLGSKEGHVVIGGNGYGKESNQFQYPRSLSFDAENNLYVDDTRNDRIQRFEVDQN